MLIVCHAKQLDYKYNINHLSLVIYFFVEIRIKRNNELRTKRFYLCSSSKTQQSKIVLYMYFINFSHYTLNA